MTPLLEIIIFGLVGLILFAGFVLLCKSFRRDEYWEDENNNEQEKG